MDKNLLDYATVMKLNKAAAFLTFIVKEVYEYLNLKTDDGALIFDVRNKYFEVEVLKKDLDSLNTHLNLLKRDAK
jgi:hypothetical protein